MKVACTVWLGAKGVKASDLSRLLLNSEYSAKYLQQLWKKVRKQGGLCTGITQNVIDLLQNYTATTMLANSEFVALLKQANTDSSKMAEVIGVFVASLVGFTILKPTHLLWINLITDCFPALALGLEVAERNIMCYNYVM